jgi:hypothetical protein
MYIYDRKLSDPQSRAKETKEEATNKAGTRRKGKTSER